MTTMTLQSAATYATLHCLVSSYPHSSEEAFILADSINAVMAHLSETPVRNSLEFSLEYRTAFAQYCAAFAAAGDAALETACAGFGFYREMGFRVPGFAAAMLDAA